MESKINIAELLNDCPKGMELDCILFNSPVKYESNNDAGSYPISVRTEEGELFYFSKYGCIYDTCDSKCAIFPKGKTTWEGFVPPCKFKDGDVITDSLGTCIFKGEGEFEGCVNYYCGISDGCFSINDDKRNPRGHYGFIVNYRLSTEEEKQQLFDAIKANGYKWNAETKTLEKLPKFKVGDRVKTIYGDFQYDIKELTDTHYTLVEVEYKYEYTEPIIEDKNWELVPNKFDINTLIPFESKVLVRDHNCFEWEGEIFTRYAKSFNNSNFVTLGGESWKQCIPYNDDTKRLLGTTDDCDEYFKNWE